ncbi:MAG: hypothetical protein IH594_16310, partial [Bacteroidales bacterium]|nr:hypothetical protein [Bacteroidales bacterium]
MPVYHTSSTILINDTDDRSLVNNDDLLKGLGLPGGLRNLENQIMILKSRSVSERALEALPFEVEFYFKTWRNQIPIFPDIPVRLLSDIGIPLPRNDEFLFSYRGDNRFSISSTTTDSPLLIEASFGENIELPGGEFMVECLDKNWFSTNKDIDLYFVLYDKNNLVKHFNSRLNVELISTGGSILEVSIEGTNKERDAEFLKMLIEVFQSVSLEKKNTEAMRRIRFIDEQLIGISDSLSLTENRLQQFRSSNRVMDVSAQGQAIIAQITELENERARLNLQANYYDYLADYLAKDISDEVPIVPITMGIEDPGLSRLVEELAQLQEQLASRGAGEMNPILIRLQQRVRTTKDALMETLNGLRRANSLARHENQEQLDKVNSQATALPATERQLLGFERKFRLNNELYTFLLSTRAEQQMQKASNMADSEVIEPVDPHFSVIVAPKPPIVYSLSLIGGFGIPFLIIFLAYIFDKRLKEEDLIKMTDKPVVGNIPRSTEKTNKVVFDYPNSSNAEAYRLLRSKMQFFTKNATNPVIMITSAMPGDGKTYTAINLASVYSILGKKTVLVGFDLRKPGIYNDFN